MLILFVSITVTLGVAVAGSPLDRASYSCNLAVGLAISSRNSAPLDILSLYTAATTCKEHEAFRL